MYTFSFKGNKLLPDMPQAISVIRQAWNEDDGARDVRPLMFTLSQLDVVDPRLWGYIFTRTAAITSYEWEIAPVEAKDADHALAVQKRLGSTINALCRDQITAYLYGAWCPRLEWHSRPGEKWKPRYIMREPVEYEYNRDGSKFPGNIALLETRNNRTLRSAITDPRTALSMTFKTRRRGGILTSCLPRIVLLNTNLQHWANYNQKLKGLAISKWRQGAAAEDQNAAVQAIKTLGETNMAAVSDDINFDFKSFVDALGKDSYREFKVQLESDIAIAIKGEANTQQLPNKGGSRAALQVQAQIGADITFMTLLDIEKVVNEQLLAHDWYMNQSHDEDPDLPYRFRFKLDELADQETNGRIASMLYESGLPVESEWFYSMFGAPMPEGTPGILQRTEEGFSATGGTDTPPVEEVPSGAV